ncbi:MAG: penicillin-binding protein 1C [Bernardetiaceae bacterium]|nr:penicillin-binding protein 1C [Bernardetiaceae bacterium]
MRRVFQKWGTQKVVLHYLRWIVATGILCCILFAGLHMAFPLPCQISYSRLILARDGTLLQAYLSPDDKWRMKTELHEITPELRQAFINKEDRFFYYHFGVNPLAIVRALVKNIIQGKTTSGASTITMQVARLLEPKKRSYAHKLVEIFRAFQLEWTYSKEEILQLYLNLVPYGGNIEGIKAASLLYFGRMPDKLSLAQAVTLAIVPNRPTSLGLGKNNQQLVQARNQWLRKFQQAGIFTEEAIADALSEPLNAQRIPLPSLAPHLGRQLHRATPASEANIVTCIHPDIQLKTMQIAAAYAKSMAKINVHNTAVLVVDNRTHEVLAYVGSQDFSDNLHAGQVDGVHAIRSPGSALKPLLYALAFDAGLLTPKTVISDVPVDFNGYSPENFDQKFNGYVSVTQALTHSLNIPAVKVLHELGVSRMVKTLQLAQFAYISRQEKQLGLSLALGGCGVSLWEMTGLYAAFANQGRFTPLRLVLSSTDTTTRAIISPQAAFVINEILTQVTRPELPSDYEHNPHIPKIAWKTGTSYGRRDAWSIGYNTRYTIAVWTGNFNNIGSPELTGAAVATPLLFRLFNAIDYNQPLQWFKPPTGLQKRSVCIETGLPPSEFCTQLVSDWYVPGVSPSVRCQHLKPVFVSTDAKVSYCSYCLPANEQFGRRLFPNHAPEMVAFLFASGIQFEQIPPHYAACTKIINRQSPVIVSPAEGRTYLRPDAEGVELLLACRVANDVSEVFWYINDKFYSCARSQDPVFFKPSPGKHKIACTDDKGMTTTIEIQVR